MRRPTTVDLFLLLTITGLLLGCSSTSRRTSDEAEDIASAGQEPSDGREGLTDTPDGGGLPEDAGAPDIADVPNGAEDATVPTVDVDDSGPDVVDPPPTRPIPPPTFATSSGRIIAIGDVHGDIGAARKALFIAGVIDEADEWIGGETVVVQVGDQLDRGDDEREILDWFEVLADQAFAAGGAFYPLVGNHEQMNTQLDFRYVTDGGWTDFQDIVPTPGDPLLTDLQPHEIGRGAAFRPGGPYANLLAGHNVVMVVDTTLFVHGGILPHHVTFGLEELNDDHQAWMRGEQPLSSIWQDSESPVWDRSYSKETGPAECAVLQEVLDALAIERIVVAHTVQSEGINGTCDLTAVRVDVGLAAHYGGPAEVLEIMGGSLTVLY